MMTQTNLAVRSLLELIRNPLLPPIERAAAGRALAEVGDPRPGVGVRPDGVPDIDWVCFAAGEVSYQEGEHIMLPSFCLSRYPVTAAQFQAFVEAEDGFETASWWEGLVSRERTPTDQPCPHANHPRENVSWCAAIAFCRWLSHRLGQTICLPSEQQWERAARGPAGRAYPWGNRYSSGCANLNELPGDVGPYRLGYTAAVGLYPAGDSPEGVCDLIGNVWEWCLNEFWDCDSIELSSGGERVMRGGSWSCAARDLTACSRELDLPDYGYGGVGFRVVGV
ncbi:MAG: SUMF1/EgtB/PvdO family nonheme iron enzyme [Chloroflexi bacterium]|nr:SUMF1/EgtB/PvdO family nonheme iron enzyme [Chloroflexota bacterium]